MSTLSFFENLTKEINQSPLSKSFTMEEVAQHNKETDCWVVVNNNVYKVDGFLNFHPGGKNKLMKYAGKDATDAVKSVDVHKKQFALFKKALDDKFIGKLIVPEVEKEEDGEEEREEGEEEGEEGEEGEEDKEIEAIIEALEAE